MHGAEPRLNRAAVVFVGFKRNLSAYKFELKEVFTIHSMIEPVSLDVQGCPRNQVEDIFDKKRSIYIADAR